MENKACFECGKLCPTESYLDAHIRKVDRREHALSQQLTSQSWMRTGALTQR